MVTGQPLDLAAITKAAVRVEKSRITHQLWIEYYRRHPDEVSKFEATVGDIAHHQEVITEYDQVLAVLAQASRLAAALAAAERRERETAQLGLDALRKARGVITQMLSTGEKWRYDRVCWAFAVMLCEVPEDAPPPAHPDDRAALAGEGAADQPRGAVKRCWMCGASPGQQHARACSVDGPMP
ncbi:hypothetical protein GCM10009616_36010 [Microlunatus lacustris]